MGEVYKARDTRLDRTVAIKVLIDLPDKPELTQRFEREARAIAALNISSWSTSKARRWPHAWSEVLCPRKKQSDMECRSLMPWTKHIATESFTAT